MKMFARDPAAKLEERTWAGNKQWTMWAPMLALQTPDPAAGFPSGTILEPIILLRNATAKRQRASITLRWRGDSAKGQVKLPDVNLKPFETRQLEIGPIQKKVGIPDDAHWALVTFTSPASPDDLLAVAASYDSTGRYGAQTPFSDNLGAYWSGGQWQVDATHNAIVAVTNGGNRATEALLTLHFDDGKKNYEIQQTIQPGDQMWLNFADLIHHSVPDRKGNALPVEITSGTYDLEDLNPGLGGNLIEGKVVLDKTWGHLTYGCLTWSTATVTSFNGHGIALGITNGYATATVPSGDAGNTFAKDSAKEPAPDRRVSRMYAQPAADVPRPRSPLVPLGRRLTEPIYRPRQMSCGMSTSWPALRAFFLRDNLVQHNAVSSTLVGER